MTPNSEALYRALRERQQRLEEAAVDARTIIVKAELGARCDEINRTMATLTELEHGQQIIPGT